MASLDRTARLTGLAYLGLAISGVLGFMLVRQQIFVPGDAAATLVNLVSLEGLARAGVALELGIVLTQVAAALLFFKLFRSVDSFAAGSLAVFGLLNAVVVLCSAALLGAALSTVTGSVVAAAGSLARQVQLLYVLSENFWGVGNQFFGLWLIPMGWLVVRSGWLPRALGWLLVVGGVGYMLSGLLLYLAPGATVVGDALTLPATVGEFWVIVHLLVRGVRRRVIANVAVETPVVART